MLPIAQVSGYLVARLHLRDNRPDLQDPGLASGWLEEAYQFAIYTRVRLRGSPSCLAAAALSDARDNYAHAVAFSICERAGCRGCVLGVRARVLKQSATDLLGEEYFHRVPPEKSC